MRTSSCIAMLALRMRVSMSAMGSVMVMCRLPSPARLGHAGQLAGVGQLAQADPAQPELAVHRVRAAAPPAAGVGPHLELGLALLLVDERLLRHGSLTLALERETHRQQERSPGVVRAGRR